MKKVMVVIVLVLLAGCATKQSTPSLTPREESVIKQYRSALAELAVKSTTADSLLAFYDQRAVPATDLGDGRVMIVGTSTMPEFFVISVMPSKRSIDEGKSRVMAAYSAETRHMALAECDEATTFSRGLLFGHEIFHAQRHLSGEELPSQPFSNEWLIGEQGAHWTVFQILNQITAGQWKEVAKASRAERESLSVSMGHQPSAYTLSPAPGDSSRVVQIFPKATRFDLAVLLTQLAVDANMLNIQKFAGDDHEAHVRGILEFLTYFYEKAYELDPDHTIQTN